MNDDNWPGLLTAKLENDQGADYGAALDNANEFFDDVADDEDTNVVLFIGNGLQTGAWFNEKEQLEDEHNAEIDVYMADFVSDDGETDFQNLQALDNNGLAWVVYTDDPSAAGGFGVAQEQLNLSEYLI